MAENISRREFLRMSVIGGGAALAGCEPVNRGINWLAGLNNTATPRADGFTETGSGFQSVEIPSISFPEARQLERVGGAAELQAAWNEALAKVEKEYTELELPKGEFLIDRKLTLEVPDGVTVTFKGNPEGTRIKGSPRISELPDPTVDNQASYEGHTHNLLEFGVGQDSRIIIDRLSFHHGSDRAGSPGYHAPLGPWNAIVAVYGRGPGDGIDYKYAVPQGQAKIENCYFEQSEGPGLVVQNLKQFSLEHCQGKNLDCLATANWCGGEDDLCTTRNCQGENMLSDFIFGYRDRRWLIENCRADLCWAGFNFRGCSGAVVQNSYIGHSLAAFTTSEGGRPSSNIGFINVMSSGSSCVYAFQYGDNIQLIGGQHDRLGEVLNNQVFLSRVSNPEWIARMPIYVAQGDKKATFSKLENLNFRVAKDAPHDYQVTTRFSGSKFFAPAD